MLNLVATMTCGLTNYLQKFASVISRNQVLPFGFYVAALLLERKRTNIQTIWADCPTFTYERFRYFLSRSKWDPQQVNTLRVRSLESDHRTRSSSRGILGIDDTSCLKSKTCKATEGAQYQYFGTTGELAVCNTLVVTAYCDPDKHWPVNLLPYRPAAEFLPLEELSGVAA